MAEFIEEKHNTQYQVLTENGWEDFSAIGKTTEYDEYELQLENEMSLIGADTHIVICENDEQKYLKDLTIDDIIKTKNGLSKVKSIKSLNKKSHMYDLIDVESSKYYTNDILSHNSTTSGSYALWYAIFNDDKYIAIASNKLKSATTFLKRIKGMYEQLPVFLKPGVTKWNETSIAFDNGSEIVVGATTPDSFRGNSINCISGNSKITIRKNNKIIYGKIKDFENCSNCEILTRRGFKKFNTVICNGISNKNIKFYFSNNESLTCTYDHKLLIKDELFKEANDINTGDVLYNNIKVINKEYINEDIKVYDALNVEDTHSFYANDIVVHNCLILDELAFVSPNMCLDGKSKIKILKNDIEKEMTIEELYELQQYK